MNLPDRYRGGDLLFSDGGPVALPIGGRSHADRFDVRHFIAIFRRRLLLFGLVTALCTLLALIITMAMPEQYRARADVVINIDSATNLPGSDERAAQEAKQAPAIATEIETLTSSRLAGEVFDRLKLAENPRFREAVLNPRSTLGNLLERLGIRRSKQAPDLTGKAFDDWFRTSSTAWLRGRTEVERIGDAYALGVTITAPDPVLAAELANGLAMAYGAEKVSSKVADNEEAIETLKSRMNELREQAQADFAAVQQYRVSNNLLSAAATGMAEGEVSTYNQEVAAARASASEDAARLAAARAQLGRGTGNVGAGTASTVVNALRAQRAGLSANIAEMSKRYVPSHPDLVAAKQQLADIDNQIDEEVGRTIKALEAQAATSRQRLASLETSRGSTRSVLASNNRSLVALEDLSRKAAASQALYESYLQRYNEVAAQSGAERSNSRIISEARVPGQPSSPRFALNMAFGLVLGLLLGGASALAAEASYAGFTTREDVEDRLGIRFLATVPLLNSTGSSSKNVLDTVRNSPGSLFNETLRGLLASIRQASSSRNQVIAMTSAVPDEGKTTLSASLSYVVGRTGERVCIVDCDVVRRDFSQTLQVAKDRPGLREVLMGEVPFAEAIVTDEAANISILPITTPFEPGLRLMEKGRLNRLIAKLREEFDTIILDCPPVLPIAEVREIVTLADNVVFIVRWRKTKEVVVKAALKLLPLRRLSDIGIVLNCVDLKQKIRFGYDDPTYLYKKHGKYYEE